MTWFYLALLVPLLSAIVNLLDDNLLQFVYKSPYVAGVSAGFYGSLPLLSLFFLDAHALPANLGILAFLAGMLTLLYYLFFFKGLDSEVPSIVVAMFGLAPATIPFFAHFIVHEKLAMLQVLGFMIVLVASLGLAVTDIKKLKFSKALIFVTIAVVFMDASSIMTKYVYQRADFYSVYMYFSAGIGAGALAVFLYKYDDNIKAIKLISKSIKRLLPLFMLTELIGVSAEFTANQAISRGPVSLVKVIEGIQPMFVLLIALALYPVKPKFFREAEEGGAKQKFILMAVIIAGLAIIGFNSN